MKLKIKKKDIKIFAMGFIAAFILNIVSDWGGSVKSYQEGYKAGREFLGITD